MKKKHLYLMRHGQTVFNERGRTQGAVDSPLTPLGKKQAQVTKENYFDKNGVTFDHAYSSTQERASDTLELVTDMPYTRLKALKEMNFGTLDGEPEYLQPPYSEFPTYFKTIGGESYDEVWERSSRALQDIVDKDDHESVLALTHGVVIHIFNDKHRDTAKTDVPERLNNCCVMHYEYDPETKTFSLVEAYNDLYTGGEDDKANAGENAPGVE